MKTIIVVRHAKSSWANEGQPDIERPLNDRGKKDAPEMAKRVKEKCAKIDLFVSSPAKRANKTAKLFAEEFGADKEKIMIVTGLYEAAPAAFYTAISQLPDAAGSAALFSHNPGITEFVNTLTNVHVDDMVTCAVFAVSADTDKWSSFKEAAKSFLFFDYPKNPIA
jgi:phosphohistidine phosphatase